MTNPTGNWTFSPYAGKITNHSTRCFWAGFTPSSFGRRMEPGAVGLGIGSAAKLHLADRNWAEPTHNHHPFQARGGFAQGTFGVDRRGRAVGISRLNTRQASA